MQDLQGKIHTGDQIENKENTKDERSKTPDTYNSQ